MRLWAVGLTIMLSLSFVVTALVRDSDAVAGPQVVKRVFYLTSQGTLNLAPPQAGSPIFSNITTVPLYFGLLQPLRSPYVTVFSTIVFSLWVDSNVTGIDLPLEGTFHEKLLTGQTNPTWNNVTALSVRRIVTSGPTPINFTYNIAAQPLVQYSQIAISFRVQNLLPGVFLRVSYDSVSSPSLAVIPMSGYLSLDTDRVDILDRFTNPATTFNLNPNSTLPANVIIFQVRVRAALGIQDVNRVNLTVIDPAQRPVKSGANLTMAPVAPLEPFLYTVTWVFSSNATEGVYQVWVDIIDAQNFQAYSFRGPTTFVLSRGFFLAPPLNLIPYVAVGGTGAVGAVLYYRRRRSKKSYFVPFDHFNTLTGGELDGGTVIAVEGNTGSGKTLLSEELMFEDLRKGRPCVFVATADFPSNIRNSMKSMGLDVTGYERSGMLTFVDGYSSEAGQESAEKIAIPSLGDLTTLGIKITSSLPTGSFKGGSLYFDSLTPLASKTKPESIVSLVQSVGARVKGMSGKAFFTVGPGVDGVVQRQVEELSDCVVQMEAFEERGIRKNRLRIAKFRARKYQQGWVIYTVEEGKGIIFYSKKPSK